MKKPILFLLLLCSFIVTNAVVDPNGGEGPKLLGWSYYNISEVKQEGGTGNCFQETTGTYYVFWIAVETKQRYRYADCETGAVLGDWVDSLMGMAVE